MSTVAIDALLSVPQLEVNPVEQDRLLDAALASQEGLPKAAVRILADMEAEQ
jgi:hypothetical protein